MATSKRVLRTVLILIPIAVSIVAVVVACISLGTSRKSFELARLEYGSSRALVLEGEFKDNGQLLSLHPVSEEFTIVSIDAHEPWDIGSDGRVTFIGGSLPFTITPPQFSLDLEQLKKRVMRNYLKQWLPVDVGNTMTITTLPLILETEYVAKGNRFTDMSIYELQYILYHEVDTRFIHVRFQGFGFRRRLSSSEARLIPGLFGDAAFIIQYETASLRMADTKDYTTIGDNAHDGTHYRLDKVSSSEVDFDAAKNETDDEN